MNPSLFTAPRLSSSRISFFQSGRRFLGQSFFALGVMGLFWTTLRASELAPVDFNAEVKALTDYTVEGMSRRLGPDYDFYHKGKAHDDFPEIYLRPEIPFPPEAKNYIKEHNEAWAKRRYQVGGPWSPKGGDYSSTQGQILYVPENKLKIDAKTGQPNDGVGVDRVTIIEMSNHAFTEKPEAPWWGAGSRPDPTAVKWVKEKGTALGVPIASARGMGSWANCGLILFSSGYVATAGTVTGAATNPTFAFPSNKVVTSIAVTNQNEFALVTVIDTETKTGQVAVLSLTGGGEKAIPHEWQQPYPSLPNIAMFTGIKLLGYVDLPGMQLPTGVTAVGNRTGGRVNGRNGHAGMLREYDLARQADRDVFLKGSNAGYSSRAGFAAVISKSEGKVAFLDLQMLFANVREAYFTTEENFQKTRRLGAAPDQWPYTFDHDSSWRPKVVKVMDIATPTAVLATMNGGDARTFVASIDGTVTLFKVGGLSTEAEANPADVAAVSTVKVGRNPTCLAYVKYSKDIMAVSRGDRSVSWIKWKAGKNPSAEVTATLRDRRLLDPVFVESADTHGIQAPIITVADFAGRKILNYRTGVLNFATQGGERFGVGPEGKDRFECGGGLEFPGYPLSISAANVN